MKQLLLISGTLILLGGILVDVGATYTGISMLVLGATIFACAPMILDAINDYHSKD